jgi:L-threonylcarbamoyladenylate synthase
MERIQLSQATMGECVRRAADVLKTGGVIIYPTDTLYGLGADAFSDEAVDMVYEIKGRDEKKPIHCIVADVDMAQAYAKISADARLMIERLMPGELTLVLSKHPEHRRGIGRDIETIGIRIPKNDFCVALARAFGKPFTATSANRAGEKPERNIEAIIEQLAGMSENITLAIDAGELPPSAPSTVVDMTSSEPVIVREGAIPVADIWNAIRAET